MTAPRTCRRCGARLPGDVAWCLRCYQPARHLTPREKPLPPLADVEEPPPWVRRSPLRGMQAPIFSRWRAGPTTFGPVGRMLITVVVLVAFPWAIFVTFDPWLLWYTMGYTVTASLVLRHTWRRERVTDPTPGPLTNARAHIARRAPVLARPIDAKPVMIGFGVLVVSAVGYAALRADAVGLFGLVVVGGAVGLGVFLAWFNEW